MDTEQEGKKDESRFLSLRIYRLRSKSVIRCYKSTFISAVFEMCEVFLGWVFRSEVTGRDLYIRPEVQGRFCR